MDGPHPLGASAGDVVAILLPDWAEVAYAFLACERVGMIRDLCPGLPELETVCVPGGGTGTVPLGDRFDRCPSAPAGTSRRHSLTRQGPARRGGA